MQEMREERHSVESRTGVPHNHLERSYPLRLLVLIYFFCLDFFICTCINECMLHVCGACKDQTRESDPRG